MVLDEWGIVSTANNCKSMAYVLGFEITPQPNGSGIKVSHKSGFLRTTLYECESFAELAAWLRGFKDGQHSEKMEALSRLASEEEKVP